MENQVSRKNKRYKAKRLFDTQKYTAREICKMVDVTEATMSKWVKRYGWKNPDTAGFTPKVAALGLIQPGLVDFLKQSNPEILHQLGVEIQKYSGSYKTITFYQAEKINLLVELNGLSDLDRVSLFSTVVGKRTEKVDQLKFDEAQYIIELLSSTEKEFEVVIKKVNN